MRTVDDAADEFGGDRLEGLPDRVRDALGELAGAAKEGLLALSVGVGLGVLSELMEAEVDEVVGPRGKHDLDRVAVRHGHEAGEVTLGGRRVAVERPRARAADGSEEVPLETYRHFAARDALSQVVLERMLAGVSTRRYQRIQEPVGDDVEQAARSTSKSAISREFVARTRETLAELMSRRLDDVRLVVLMIDGICLKERTNVVALGITTDGVKIPLGLWDGSTENATVATALLADLVDRGLDVEQGVLCVLDGSKALRKPCATCSAPCRSSAVSATRSATCSSTCPSATARRSSAGCGRRGRSTTTTARSISSSSSPASSTAPAPAPPRRCGRALRRRSHSPAWAPGAS